MTIGDLFKSKKDRVYEETKKRRKAFREAENAVDVVRGRIAKLKKTATNHGTKRGSILKTARKRPLNADFRPAGPVRCSWPNWR